IVLSNMTQPYSGTALSPTVTTVPAGVAVSLMGAPQTAVGSYPVTASVADPNYAGTPASGNFVISGLSSFALNGPATVLNASGLRLTDNKGSETSSAWYPYELPVATGF